jgi:thiamine biosynthesis lipoprotein
MKHVFILFFIAIIFLGCQNTDADASHTEFVLNTVCTIFLYDQASDDVYDAVFDGIREIESRMSAYLPNSDIARINAAAGIAPVEVHDDVFEVLERAVRFAQISDRAFDPTVGPLTALWGISGDNPRVPSQEEIDAVLPLVNWQDIELDREHKSVFLRQTGMALDLGAIAKGYAADRAVAIIKEAQLKRALIDLGGNVITYGAKKDKTPWKIGLQDPREKRGSYIGIISGWDQTVVTSGVYERFFIEDGVRYHHLFSPADGFPARTGLLSVSIITDISMDADALSTAVFVLGYEKGKALLESLENVEAVFVFENGSVRKTAGAAFELTSDAYRLLID